MKRVKYALIGFGGIAENRIAKEGFACDRARFKPLKQAVLVGATDINPGRRAAVEALGLKWYKDAAAVCADPAIDAVFVATNNLTHATLARQALEAGKAVIADKPLAANSQEARMLVKLAAKKKLSLSVDHMMTHNALNLKARQLVAGGKLGAVNDACFHMQFAYGFDPAEAATWRCANRAEMGGPIGDVASHCFYMAELLLGSRVRSVRAVYYPKRMAIKVEDGALIQCDLENGVTFSVLVSFCDARGGLGGTLSNLGYEIYGERAVLRGYGTMFQLSGHAGEPLKMRLELDEFKKQKNFAVTNPVNIYQGVITEHAVSVLKGKPLTGLDGLRNVLMCEAAHASAQRGGRTVRIRA
ncbi:MAG: Gfo/Idh/MocA family oxidoreductase [Kiritimatiellae bacterium]|nr:Gfo/Idh/MocA family oxidoreductase [Kiritimatiellia bacterium]MDD4024848.1 Gfo/Idh/MocA family oxidoreductase [Kiritimatiellia bacterium]